MSLLDWVFIALGLTIGSFLNVCIVRVPRDQSIASPRSSCRHCHRTLKPYDNIPLISFLLLGGRCRYCQATISWQYPVVEALTAAVYWVTYTHYGLEGKTAVLLPLFSALIVLVFIDLNERILPDVITRGGIVLGLTLSLVVPLEDPAGPAILHWAGLPGSSDRLASLLSSLTGVVACGGFLWLVAEAYFRLKKVEGMGFGDVKLMGMLGAFLGVKMALLTLLLGSVLGSVVGMTYIGLTGKDSRYELPFGSFLGIAGIAAALWGEPLVAWYLGITGRL